jgi:hypothetical protein
MVINYSNLDEDIASLYRLRDIYKHELEYCDNARISKQYSQKIIEIHEKIVALRKEVLC